MMCDIYSLQITNFVCMAPVDQSYPGSHQKRLIVIWYVEHNDMGTTYIPSTYIPSSMHS